MVVVVATPTPVSATLMVPFTGSLLTIVSAAERAPTAWGVNVTLMLHAIPDATEVPQVFPVMAKSPGLAPVITMP